MLTQILFYSAPGLVIGFIVALMFRFGQKKFLPAFLITALGIALLQFSFVHFVLGGKI